MIGEWQGLKTSRTEHLASSSTLLLGRWTGKEGGEHLTLHLAILVNELSGASLHSNFPAPEALSSHPRQPLLVNNNSLFKNSSINLFALLLSVPGFYPQQTWKRCATSFLLSFSR